MNVTLQTQSLFDAFNQFFGKLAAARQNRPLALGFEIASGDVYLYSQPGGGQHVDQCVDRESSDLAAHQIRDSRLRYTYEFRRAGWRDLSLFYVPGQSDDQFLRGYGGFPLRLAEIRSLQKHFHYLLSLASTGPFQQFTVPLLSWVHVERGSFSGFLREDMQYMDSVRELGDVENTIFTCRMGSKLCDSVAGHRNRLPINSRKSSLNQTQLIPNFSPCFLGKLSEAD